MIRLFRNIRQKLAAGDNLWIVEEDYKIMLDDINKLIKLIDQDLKPSTN